MTAEGTGGWSLASFSDGIERGTLLAHWHAGDFKLDIVSVRGMCGGG